MRQSSWVRSSECFSLRSVDGGLVVYHPTGNALLTAEEAAMWARFDIDEFPPPRLAALAQSGIVRLRDANEDRPPSRWDPVTLRVPASGLRWYRESPDLVVLFNTRQMPHHNPLLVLGAQGSMAWQGVLEGQPISRIREQATAAFDRDEVIPLLARLVNLGFLAPELDLARTADSEPSRLEIPAPRAQALIGHALVPWYCLWEVNTTCDLRCRTCYLPDFSDPGVTHARAGAIAEQIAQAGALYTCLLGGEFLLREDAVDLVQRLRDTDLYVKIITNGRSLTRELARSLAAAGLNQIEVSFDGLSLEQHERSRGRGTWHQALIALALARDAGISRGGVVFTVHSENQGQITQLPDFLDAVGVSECYLSPFKKTGRQGAKASWDPPDPAALASVLSVVTERRPDLTLTLLPSCSCGRTSVVIGHDENVRTCSFSYTPVGSLRERPLREVWRSLTDRLPSRGPTGFCSASRLRVLG